MIKIDKSSEPIEWKKFRLTPGVCYEAKPELKKALLEEQGYICAYCMRRIPVRDSNSDETSRIEHIKCQTNYSHLALHYNNMVICCPGAINSDFHCDKKKEKSDITFSLFRHNIFDTISYETKSGKIKSSDSKWDNEINTILNLNNVLLQLHRKEVIDATRKVLADKRWKNAKLNEQLSKWQSLDKNGKRKAYCGVVIWYLSKKIK